MGKWNEIDPTDFIKAVEATSQCTLLTLKLNPNPPEGVQVVIPIWTNKKTIYFVSSNTTDNKTKISP